MCSSSGRTGLRLVQLFWDKVGESLHISSDNVENTRWGINGIAF